MAVLDDPGRGGTGLLERPGLDLSRDGAAPSTESGYGAASTDGSKRLGGGNYRVLLLDSEKHTEGLVVKVVPMVVPGVEEAHARNCFHTARDLGMAIIVTALKEHAEFYAQQLYRNGVRSSIEPDTTTI